ncbi:MAG: TetR/AcrR family transcriptional regulator [Mycobacterium sp.]
MPTTSGAAVKSAGRPRDPGIDDAVRTAAREVLVEFGYEDTTLAAIAHRAGVSIPAIYRRWPSKHELIEEAVLHLDTFDLPRPTGDLRADLGTWVRLFLDVAMEPAARAAVPGLMSAYSRNPDDYNRLLTRGEIPVRAAIEEMVRRAVATGQAAENCDAGAVFDLIRGATFLRALTHSDDGADEFCARITDAVVRVVATR